MNLECQRLLLHACGIVLALISFWMSGGRSAARDPGNGHLSATDQMSGAAEWFPEREEVLKATVAIQAFVLNVIGCLDNLAWIWVYERGITANGAELDPKSVGLWKRHVQQSMSKEFRAYLDSRRPWFDAINELRDALVHRVPLYIPPYVVDKSKINELNRLEQEATAALARGDHAAYDRIRADQEKLGESRPWVTHSFYEQSDPTYFHFQLLCDWLTIEELGLKLLEELDGCPP
jgi:hypothetical protein